MSTLMLLTSKYIAPNIAFRASAYILSVISASPSPFIRYFSKFNCLAIIDKHSGDINCISALCNCPSLEKDVSSTKITAITSFST